ncbi:inositol monophosphatase family protein [Neptunicoccus cionae]|uniref:inositol monophosphatase family protein n=1 Tax=Neptunicoccus cionae TaxID=2035344 RepID=UPI000C78FC44|nr:inositol monophosphatase family protein [Amylibacter cionae]PLS22956.1 inositol monophosphatase [Amylibacter cionae]
MSDLKLRLETATRITEQAAKVAMAHFRNSPDIETKSDQSPVTVADKETETAIRDGLARAFPQEPIYGEEFGRSGTGADMWIVDPIDGTRSFITGLPLFGLLLGYLHSGTPQLGIIRMPALGETYTGAVGLGAMCNGVPVQSSRCESLATARLFLNEGDKLAVREPAVFSRLVQAGELRRMGADCYPHALVARGLADAVVDYDLQPYDYLPVSAVVHAAGGIMTDWEGQALTMNSDGRTLTAATPALHRELMELVNA